MSNTTSLFHSNGPDDHEITNSREALDEIRATAAKLEKLVQAAVGDDAAKTVADALHDYLEGDAICEFAAEVEEAEQALEAA